MPSVEAIYAHWGERFGTPDATFCMACKEDGHDLARAHIVANFDGGSETVENLLLLCRTCHKHQEFLCSVLVAGQGNPAVAAACGAGLDDLESILELSANDAAMMGLKRILGHLNPISVIRSGE